MMDTNISELSEREQEILRLIATGASNKEIAQQLFISINTVRVHVRNIFVKIAVSSRTEAAMYAVRIGLVDSPAANFANHNGSDQSPVVAPVSEAVILPEIAAPVEVSPVLGTSPLRKYWWAAVVLVLAVMGLSLGLPALLNQAAPTATGTIITPPAPTWVDLPDMPTARRGLAVAVLEDQIFTFGGESSAGVTAVTESYSIASNSWQTRASKPSPVTDVSGAVLGGFIYIPGGMTPSGKPTSVLEVYDPSTDSWQTRASLPKSLSAYALVAFEGRLYLFGGNDGEAVSTDVYIYDPAADQWLLGTSMPVAREKAGPVISSGRIFLLGGKNETGILSSCDFYFPNHDNGDKDPWSECNDMPEPLHSMGVTGVADMIVIIGGQGDGSQSSSYQFAPQTGTWQKVELDRYPTWTGPSLIPLGTSIFMVGGEIDGEITSQASFYQMLFTVVLPIFK